MAKKKQSRVVAGQNKARERARRKAHYAGPSAAPSTAAPGVEEADGGGPSAADEVGESAESSQVSIATAQPMTASRTERAAPTTTQRRRVAQAMVTASGPSLRSETTRIGIVSAVVAAILIGLKFGTTIGA